MKIDLSNPPYAVKLKELGFAYSYTDCEKGIIVYTHADPILIGSPWHDHWNDMECIIDFEVDILPRMNAGDSRILRFGFLFDTTKQEGRGR